MASYRLSLLGKARKGILYRTILNDRPEPTDAVYRDRASLRDPR